MSRPWLPCADENSGHLELLEQVVAFWPMFVVLSGDLYVVAEQVMAGAHLQQSRVHQPMSVW